MARKEAVKRRRPPLVVIACDRTRLIRTLAPTPPTPRSAELSVAAEAMRGELRLLPPLASPRPPGQVSDAGCHFSSRTAGTAAGAVLPE